MRKHYGWEVDVGAGDARRNDHITRKRRDGRPLRLASARRGWSRSAPAAHSPLGKSDTEATLSHPRRRTMARDRRRRRWCLHLRRRRGSPSCSAPLLPLPHGGALPRRRTAAGDSPWLRVEQSTTARESYIKRASGQALLKSGLERARPDKGL